MRLWETRNSCTRRKTEERGKVIVGDAMAFKALHSWRHTLEKERCMCALLRGRVPGVRTARRLLLERRGYNARRNGKVHSADSDLSRRARDVKKPSLGRVV